MISSQVQGPGPLQSILVQRQMVYNCKSCLPQKVGEVAVYFTNQKRQGCLYDG
ncbi:hypothetical protein MTR67_047815 [Solanum verrucosum]|uniref:Uncharacterized protein n=1 Tax=Solanum verrucosum TaxID=315347 RepID=A0AAF0UX62_SOLVR|nr:hypothetical protein MTR67_047815 [Solanum verrucosum]